MQKSFNDLLYSSLDDKEDSLENTEICLISQEPLTNTHVKLSCSHQFNYQFIYNEVYNQIKNPPPTEIQRLKKFQFKCPYCRNIQNGVLPYHDELDHQKIIGINWPPRHIIKTDMCSYIFASGKRKGTPCNKMCYGKYCPSHKKIIERRISKKHISLSNKCSAFTKKGSPCSRNAKPLTNYCSQHYKSLNQNNICIPTENVVITI